MAVALVVDLESRWRHVESVFQPIEVVSLAVEFDGEIRHLRVDVQEQSVLTTLDQFKGRYLFVLWVIR